MHFLIVTDGLVESGVGLGLHPSLHGRKRYLGYGRKRWAETPPLTALEWYGAVAGWRSISPILGTEASLPESARQVWLVSPYSAVVARQAVRVLPSRLLDWNAADAEWLAGLLNPLFEADGISLHIAGCGLVAACREPLDAEPQPFGVVDGGMLPDHFPAGADGGRLARLMAEAQMLLNQSPSERRQQAGQSPIHGVWFWAPAAWPAPDIPAARPAVVSDDRVVASVTHADDAGFAILTAEHVEDRLGASRVPTWVLAGEGYVVRVDAGGLPRLSRHPWRPAHVSPLASLLPGVP